ncbi:alpha/beta hydrolase family protein [Massilia litorea]|uniref:S9 family peptidase n=1 Tax=Massilia litorea TaxID=2769491 RepID=A0A7L9UAS6_9BURK|nr:S9 family peptidase [Massilia litorea]QOL51206.1 S9 family peptidase [Massilia litorea]
MSFVHTSLFHAGLLALSLWTAPINEAQAAPALPPIERFFNSPAFNGGLLSPDGRAIAARGSAPGQRDYLVVVDLQTNTGKIVASYNDADIGSFQWVNNERLLFNVGDKKVAEGDDDYAPGLFAVNRDGSNLVQLAETGNVRTGQRTGQRTGPRLLPWHTFMLSGRGAQDSDYVYVRDLAFKTDYRTARTGLLRLNTVTGQVQEVSRPKEDVTSWMLDHKGEPRIAVGIKDDMVSIHYLDPATKEWRKLTSYKAYGDAENSITPLAFGPDGKLYVSTRRGRDTSAVYTLDLATGQLSAEPLVSTKGYDFSGRIITSRDKVLGMQFTTDATSTEWFDPAMKAAQETVDKLLPATINLLGAPPQHAQTPWLLVRAYSDAIPSTYYLFNRDTKLLNKVGDTHPGIDPKQMGRQQALSYKARDGLDIPALLTMPPGSTQAKLPLVVLVHGGPWVRGSTWGWNPESQFLASRGYAVLEPSFRGTTGFGAAHYQAGFKQWGLAMQNDLADGVRWAIEKGVADPKRICIAGASYGGYATLMGLVNDPDLYQCGVDWVGVTDINLMYSSANHRSDMSDEWKRYGMPELIGDQVKDAAQLKATSPIEQAARIKAPLLLAYGGADLRVPIDHGTKFHAAVKRNNPNVEWIEYPAEGHGFYLPKNNIDFWSRVEKFLDKNIGSGATQQ